MTTPLRRLSRSAPRPHKPLRAWSAVLGRIGLAAAAIAAMTLVASPAHASLIWDGDAAKGTGVFGLIGSNCASPGSVTAVTDAERGSVWRFRKPAGSNRCEVHGIAHDGDDYHFVNGNTYYLGWSSKLSNTVDNNAVFQWKSYGDHIQNWPVVLKMIDGELTMIQRQPDGTIYTIWSTPVSAGAWNHVVVGLHLSDETWGGWVELWFNGVKQTFRDGTQRWACRTWDSTNDPKWGVYGAESSSVDNYIDDLKVGTSYADVAQPGTPPEPPPGRTEFESGTCDGTIDSNHAGFSGTGFCNTPNAAGAAAQVTVNPSASAAATLTFGYANGGTSDRPVTVLVNGAAVATLPFPPTGGWPAWATATVDADLAAGGNTVRLVATTAAGAPNLDYVDVESASAPSEYQAEECVISQGAVESNHDGFTGAGFVNTDNVSGAAVQCTVTGPATALSVRFANGTSAGRPMAVLVDGNAAGTLGFAGTGAWTGWDSESLSVAIGPGSHTVRLTASTSDGGPNLDRISLG